MKDSTETGRIFGHIPNVPVFTLFKNRDECSQAWVHRPRLSGIDGNGKVGTYSIVLSDGYQDDEDWGDVIVYTGAGGRLQWTDDNQVVDQSWNVHPNKALKRSRATENPVRVIRSSKSISPYAPFTGCRYDGLYQITRCWKAKGRSGVKICRCRLQRLPGQPPIRVHPHRFPPAVMGPNATVDFDESDEDDAIEDDIDTGEEGEEN